MVRTRWWATLCVGFLFAIAGCQDNQPGTKTVATTKTLDEKTLTQSIEFKREGKPLKTLTVAAMLKLSKAQVWSEYDPYHKKVKKWRAIELAPVIKSVFGDEGLTKKEFLLRAKDGYQVHMTGAKLMMPGAYLAIEDMDVAGWEAIGPQKANPAPFYMVWRKKDQQDIEAFARPWQLAQIDMVGFETAFPKTVPTGAKKDGPVSRGYAIFKDQCTRCHAMNREGGRVGPELNLPQNITEYRPIEQIKAYIKDPMTYRYGNMPAFKHFEDSQLDDIVAYLKAMSQLKQPLKTQP